jgi:hypothetical protein
VLGTRAASNREETGGGLSESTEMHKPPNGHGAQLRAAREGAKERPAAARRIDPRTGRPAAGGSGRPRCGGLSAPMPC